MNYDIELETPLIEVELGNNDIEIEMTGGARGLKGDKGDTGATGEQGPQGLPGAKGEPGTDGVSPIVTTSKTGKTTTLTIQDAEGTKTATILDGEDGASEWGEITGNIANQTDLKNALDNKANTSDIPTKVSDLTNDSGFIKNTVNNLTNYYTKTNTYTKTEVDNLIGSVGSLNIEVVQTLPTQDISTSTIYLLPNNSSSQGNVYDEYIYANNSWELIGSTQADLTNYYTKTQVDGLLDDKADNTDIPTKTSDLTNDSGYITSYTETDPVFSASAAAGITSNNISNWNNKLDYNSWDTTNHAYQVVHNNSVATLLTLSSNNKVAMSNLPFTNSITNENTTIPKTSAVYSALSTKANTSDIPTKTSDLTNDSDFVENKVFLLSDILAITSKSDTVYTEIVDYITNEKPFKIKETSNLFYYIYDAIEINNLSPDYSFSYIDNLVKHTINIRSRGSRVTVIDTTTDLQEELVSGTNIKTINGNSILGSGDITVSASGGDTLPIGSIVPYSGSTIPTNYLLADGSAVSRTAYSELFEVIGTTYGDGDGSTTFNLPNLKGKVSVGLDEEDGYFDSLGATGGSKTQVLNRANLPSDFRYPFYNTTAQWGLAEQSGANYPFVNGTGSAFDILQPYIVQNYIIKAKMGSGTTGTITDMYSTSTTDAYSASYINTIVGDIETILTTLDVGNGV